jgi:hypothetical protein
LGKWALFENKKLRAAFDNKKIWGSILIVILVSGTLSVSLLIIPKDRYLAEAGAVPGIMELKLGEATTILTTPGLNEATYLQGVREVPEALFPSSLSPLCSEGSVESCNQFFNLIEVYFAMGIQALIDHRAHCVETSCAAAEEVRNNLQMIREAMEVIAEQTANCNPDTMVGPGCALLEQDDEGGTIDLIWSGFAREVRSPFFYGFSQSPTPQEDVRVIPALKNKECSAVMKEVAGYKVVVRPVKIPIWVEPWFARASIIGFVTVWVWEFVPMEFIKTIEYCNINSDIVQQIESEVVIDRALMHMWKFWPKDP